MLTTSQNHLTTGALSALNPILDDTQYFQGKNRLSPALRPQIEQAIEEIENQLVPASQDRVEQIVLRLMLHFPSFPEEHKTRLCGDYTSMLQNFPEDMLCAAYQYVLKHHQSNALPRIADFLAFMEPEVERRKIIRQKLAVLLEQTTEEFAV